MKVAVRYYTKGGNTAKVAEAIATAVNEEAQSVSVPLSEPVDILFLGGSVYAFAIDPAIEAFVEKLNASTVKAAAVFSTSAISKSGNSKLEKLLVKKGIKVLMPAFYCRGEFKRMRKGHPNAQDLESAAAFAAKALQAAKQG